MDYHFIKSSGRKKRINKKKNNGKNERSMNIGHYHDSHKIYRRSMYPAYKRSIKALNRGICSKNNREKYGEDFINDSFVKIPFYGGKSSGWSMVSETVRKHYRPKFINLKCNKN